jgi:acetylglutamate kinase
MTSRAAAGQKAQILVEALPYIRTYRGQTVVVKIGGEALDDDVLARIVSEDMALLALVGVRLVVVHGGGPQVSAAMSKAGIEPRFVDGLRITDADAIEIVGQILIGSINPKLVARLASAGLSPVGLSGADASLLAAHPVEGLGRVGEIVSVASDVLDSLLADGYTPVIASVAPGPSGELLNVNADVAAGAIAGALGAAKLVYLTNVEGLYRDLGDSDSLVSEMKSAELAALLPQLSQGMRPKAASAVSALASGVQKVHILDGRVPHALLLEVFTDEGVGTQVLP